MGRWSLFHSEKLSATQVSLTPVAVAHAELLATWLNDLEVAIPLGDEAWQCITPAAVRESIAGAQHTFTIIANDTGAAIGRCLLFNVNHVDRHAMVGIFIGDKQHWNRGLGGQALELLLEYAFNLLNLHSVMLGTFAFNNRALGCYRRVGFKEIGRRRDARLIAGTYHDVILMDLLVTEFRGHLISDCVDSVRQARPSD